MTLNPAGCLDLKLENIMVTIEDPTVLADFMDSQLEKPMAYKLTRQEDQYTNPVLVLDH